MNNCAVCISRVAFSGFIISSEEVHMQTHQVGAQGVHDITGQEGRPFRVRLSRTMMRADGRYLRQRQLVIEFSLDRLAALRLVTDIFCWWPSLPERQSDNSGEQGQG